jgi:muconolactone delta-isomerase
MEYLVTMTTQVPDDVTAEEVSDVRARESARTRVLALEGRVLRLWRPPLEPGQWRTVGLFVADGPADLELTLASMPLRVWRTDDVIPLGPHPNDPGRGRVALNSSGAEFLTTFVLAVPPGTSSDAFDAMTVREAARTRELAAEGNLLRLWSLPGDGRALGHWQAPDDPGMRDVLQSLPMTDWLTVETVPLTRHPSDPATADSGAAPGGREHGGFKQQG